MSHKIGRMMAPRNITLPADHYASKWNAQVHHTPSALTEMGKSFARLPEGEEKQQKLLEICQAFHGYLTKYMGMIVQGHVPFRDGEVNQDTRLLLQWFLKGKPATKSNLGEACRMLHLAFKNMDTGEIYDALMICLIKAISRYDPDYHKKVQRVAETIREEFHAQKTIVIEQLSKAIDDPQYAMDDCSRFLRLLSKHGFLEPVTEGTKQVVAYRRTSTWPVPESFFQSGSVGVSYFVPKWFRYFLVDWINGRMGEIEAKEDILQLDHRLCASALPGNSGEAQRDPAIPHTNGDFTVAATGRAVAADMTLTEFPVDVGVLSLDWVNHTTDGLFGDLSRGDRHLLFCVFSREMDWAEIATTFGVSVREAKLRYIEVLESLRRKVMRPRIAA